MRRPSRGVLPLIKEKCNMNEKLDEVTTAPPAVPEPQGSVVLAATEGGEQRKLSPWNFYADERKKCKSDLASFSAVVDRERNGWITEFKSIVVLRDTEIRVIKLICMVAFIRYGYIYIAQCDIDDVRRTGIAKSPISHAAAREP